jgi:hypothetical protein
MSPSDDLTLDEFLQGLVEFHNAPRECELSPAQMVFTLNAPFYPTITPNLLASLFYISSIYQVSIFIAYITTFVGEVTSVSTVETFVLSAALQILFSCLPSAESPRQNQSHGILVAFPWKVVLKTFSKVKEILS